MDRFCFQKWSFGGRVLVAIFLCVFVCLQKAKSQDAFEKEPIFYSKTKANDPIAKLSNALRSGEKKLSWHPKFGWLPSILEHLGVDKNSQTLVFTKTSLQIQKIHPLNPRAIYFNDDVYIGWVPGGDLIEMSAVDADLGAVFYTIKNSRMQLKPRIKKTDSLKNSNESNVQEGGKSTRPRYRKPRIVRDKDRCLTCHATHKTQNVPGYLIRSVYSKQSGQPDYSLGTITTDSSTNFHDRFGGWYVTGSHGKMRHRGNVFVRRPRDPQLDREAGANLNSLEKHFDVEKYLVPTSDLVALMIMEHQSQVHNAISKANFEARLALTHQRMMNKVLERKEGFVGETTKRRLNSAADNLVDFLLFQDRIQLTSPISGSNEYKKYFEALGPSTKTGESLRELDCTNFVFRYPCSFLIYSESFLKLPKEIRTLCVSKIETRLAGKRREKETAQQASARHQAFKILKQTHPLFKPN